MKVKIKQLEFEISRLTDELIKDITNDNNYVDVMELEINNKYLPGILCSYFPYLYRVSHPFTESGEPLEKALREMSAVGPYTYILGSNTYYDVYFTYEADIVLLSMLME